MMVTPRTVLLVVMSVIPVWAAFTFAADGPLWGAACKNSSMPRGSKGTLEYHFQGNVQEYVQYYLYIQFNGTPVYSEDCRLILEDGAAKKSCSNNTNEGYHSEGLSRNTLQLHILNLSELTAGEYVLYPAIGGEIAQFHVACSITVETTSTTAATTTTATTTPTIIATTTNRSIAKGTVTNDDNNGISTEAIAAIVVFIGLPLAVVLIAALVYFRHSTGSWVPTWFRSVRGGDSSGHTDVESVSVQRQRQQQHDVTLSGQDGVTRPMLERNGNSRNHDIRLPRKSMKSRLGQNLQLIGKILSDGQQNKNLAKKPEFDMQLKPQTHHQEQTDSEMDDPQNAYPTQRDSRITHEKTIENKDSLNGDKRDPTNICSTQEDPDKTSPQNTEKMAAQSVSKDGNKKCPTKICSRQQDHDKTSPRNMEKVVVAQSASMNDGKNPLKIHSKQAAPDKTSPQDKEDQDAMTDSENGVSEKKGLLQEDTNPTNTTDKASGNPQNNYTDASSEFSTEKMGKDNKSNNSEKLDQIRADQQI